ncbi:MAG: hypothetical protein NT075_35420 [Chloroflexi bacterium]|nr:hypothetical protein [Chloroflexota bacterium]
MIHLPSAINHYHDLCHTGTLAQESWAVLAPGMQERQLVFGDRPLCTVLRPLFHTNEDYAYLSERTTLILQVFRKLTQGLLVDKKLRAQLYLDGNEEQLISLPTGYQTNIPTARLDSFFVRNSKGKPSLNFIEFNGESPAGMAYNDVLAELFLETPLMEKFEQRYKLESLEVRPYAVDALLRIYYQWLGNQSKLPDIAIVDWAGVPTASEFELFVDYFAEQGIHAIVCTPDDLDFHDGKMYAAGEPVDFIYKRVLSSEFLQKYGLNHPLIEALRAKAICMANPFTCKLLHKKASFALVSDERNERLFKAAELEAIRQHIPWTRMIEERYTLDSRGKKIDLLSWAVDNQERLVLKPNDDYGGKGVLIGWETDSSTWEKAVVNGLNEPSIIQERANIAYEDFPSVDEKGNVDISQRLVDCDPFLFHGDTIGGCLTRLSTVTLLNVTAGGGSVVPTFLVQELE